MPKKTKKAYIDLNDNDMDYFDELENEGQTNICLMEKYEYNEVNDLTSYFTYHKLFLVCKKLESGSNKSKVIIFVSNSPISFL